MKSRSRTMRFLTIALALMLCTPVQAQTNDLTQRLDLAKQMHDIRPTREQLDAAVEQVTALVKQDKRAAFKAAVAESLNYKALEKVSVEAMAETFTAAELSAMVDYYTKPEARSASDKEAAYRAKVMPEIKRMLDNAIMRARTESP